MPLRPSGMVVLAHRAGDQDMAQEQQDIAEGHREAEHQRDEHRQDHQAQRPVALGQRFEHRDEVEDRQRENPEHRGKEDQQAEPGAVGERVSQAFAQARPDPWMPPPQRDIGDSHWSARGTTRRASAASGSYHRFGLAMISSTRVPQAQRPERRLSTGSTSRERLATLPSLRLPSAASRGTRERLMRR